MAISPLKSPHMAGYSISLPNRTTTTTTATSNDHQRRNESDLAQGDAHARLLRFESFSQPDPGGEQLWFEWDLYQILLLVVN